MIFVYIYYKQGIPSVFFINHICFPFFVKRFRRNKEKYIEYREYSLEGVSISFVFFFIL